MSRTTVADPTLDAVVPVTPRWRSALSALLGLALLVGAGTVLAPGVLPASNGGGIDDAPGGAISSLQLEGHAVWQRVESVTGPDVAAAWLLDAQGPPGAGSAEGPSRPLPQTLRKGQRATLVIRWSSPCGTEATVRTLGPVGTIREERVPRVFTPGTRPQCDGA